MKDEKEWQLWKEYKSAWNRAEQLQERCEEDDLLFDVIYDHRNRRWFVNCVDTQRWIIERFHGGHRGYYQEVWRES